MTDYSQSIDYIHELAQQGDSSIADSITRGTFIYGYCGLYAAALVAHHPEWTVVAVGSNYCQLAKQDFSDYGDGFCSCHLDHFYASDGKWYYDAYGQHDPAALDDLTHRPISDTAFLCVLESWYGFDRESMDIAAVAVEWAALPAPNVTTTY